MRILFVGKGISNNGAILVANKYNLTYDYVDVSDVVDKDYDLIVKGPGISYESSIIKQFSNKLIITDIEFVYYFLNKYIIGITGSNGKTTTTLLINDILNKKYKSIACGNIGYSIGEAFIKEDSTHFVCELSSFELKGINLFHPNIAVITNVNSCHLDYHKTLDDYISSKNKITKNLTKNDYLIFNLDCINSIKIASSINCNKYSFSLNNQYADCYIKDNYIMLFNNKFLHLKEVNEKNISTITNYLASILVGNILNINNDDIINAIKHFKKSKYRFEYIKDNIINDAKSTNVYSTISAIKSLNKDIILLCGGMKRVDELNELNNYLNNISKVICYGESKEDIYNYFNKNNIKCIKYNNFDDAVKESINYLNNNNILLFSPMYASYDMFFSYEQRGDIFNKLVEKYNK